MTCSIPESLVGYGSILRYLDRQTGEWVVVGGTADLQPPPMTRESLVTRNDGNDGTVHRIPAPQVDYGETEFEMDFLAAQYSVLHNISRLNPPYITQWQIVLGDPLQTYFQWCAYISGLSVAIPRLEIISATLTLMPSGGGVTTGRLADE